MSHPIITTYDPERVGVYVAGLQLQGFMPGMMVEITPDAPYWADAQGADGESARWSSGNPFATMRIPLLGTSLSNIILSNLMNADRFTQAGIVPVMVTDRSNPHDGQPSRHIAPRAWVQGPPVITYASGVSGNVWALRLLDPLHDIRGVGFNS